MKKNRMNSILACVLCLCMLLAYVPSAHAATLAITRHPASAAVVGGETVTVSVAAAGDGLSYRWYYKDAGMSAYAASSVTSDSYSLVMNAERDGRRVYCRVTDINGNTVNSNSALLSMSAPIRITRQPSNMAVYDGVTAKVSVAAQGVGLSYRWYYKDAGSSTYSMSSATTATYSLTMNAARNGRRVYCRVTDQYGNTLNSNSALLTVATPLAITKQPANMCVLEGQTATATVAAQGDGLTYRWYYKDAGSSVYSASSVTTATYSLVMNADRSGRRVYCRVTDKYGNTVNSISGLLTMAEPIRITRQPADAYALSGANLSVTAAATGAGLQYRWYYKDAGSSVYAKSSVATATYTLTMSAAREGRRVYCQITDQYGQQVNTKSAVLHVSQPLAITQQPADAVVDTGKVATATVTATGDALQYRWYYKDVSSSGFALSGVTTPYYSLLMNSAARNGRQVYCVVTDMHGNQLTTDTVTLRGVEPLKITKQPVDSRVAPDRRISVEVEATGAGLTYLWYKRYKGSEEVYPQTSSYDREAYYWCYTYESMDDFEMYCEVTDMYGRTVRSDVATLGVYKVEILEEPEDVIALKGERVTLEVKATGENLTYSWKAYRPNVSSGYKYLDEESSVLSFVMSDEWDRADIYCRIGDEFGTYKSTRTINVDYPELTITDHPDDVECIIGDTVTFSVTAEGEGLKYRWYYKDENDADFLKSSVTTSTYTLWVKEANAGREVYCEVTDFNGQVKKSYEAELIAHPKVTLTGELKGIDVKLGRSGSITCPAEGYQLTYVWYYKDIGSSSYQKSDDTDKTYNFTMSEAMDGRKVYCVVTDRDGNKVTTNVATLYVDRPPIGAHTKCETCDGSGNCPECGGDMWVTHWKWVYVNGSPESKLVTELCDGRYCFGGACSTCNGYGLV